MKITNIRTAILRVVGPCVFVKIDTDEGITGLGECYPAAPASAMVETIQAMREHLIGQDPGNINMLHERIRRFNLFTGAQGGTVINALSGVEMALWDIQGKRLGVPVYQLLGGKFRDSIRMYADCHAGTVDAEAHHIELHSGDSDREKHVLEELEVSAKQALDLGYTAIKFDADDIHHPAKRDYWNWTLSVVEIDSVVRRVAKVREVIGYNIELAIDLHARFDLPSAIQVARALAPFRLMWLEEPVPPDNVDMLAQVRAASPVPICAGENVYTRYGLYNLMLHKAVDIVMPDPAKCGGILEGLRIANLAEVNGLPYAPHNVSSPLGTVAMAHLCAAISNFLVLEFHGMDLDYWEGLVKYAGGKVIQNGFIHLSDAPGWGIEINDLVARQHIHARMSKDYFGEPF
ncbi:MAG TPA: mandelate racemase/muconate lactonizing enzyme family protein [Anaerolineaceae bacterium]